MTYLTSDDAAIRAEMRDPWSRRGFVARTAIRSGTMDSTAPMMPEAPVPPLASGPTRIVRKKAARRFPTDAGYQDSGMGALGDDIASIMEQLARDMKEEAIKQAAINTGISIALSCVPIVGWAVGLVYSVVQALVGSSLQRQAEEEMANFQTEMSAVGAQWEAKVTAVQSAVFEQEKPAAIQLALSNQALGGVALGNIWEDIVDSQIFREISNPLRVIKQVMLEPIIKPVQLVTSTMARIAPDEGGFANLFAKVDNAVDRAEEIADKPVLLLDRAIDTSTGLQQLQDVRDAINAARPKALAQMKQQAEELMGQIQSPAYRLNLQKVIAAAIRNSKSLQAVSNGITVPSASVSTSQGMQLLPAAGAAGAVLLLLGMGS